MLKRMCFFSLLECAAPMHHGSGEDTVRSDMPVLRDSRQYPFVSGGALASAFASTVKDKTYPRWFGRAGENQKDAGENEMIPAGIVFDDAVPLPVQIPALKEMVEIRQRVALEADSMTASHGGHFDLEVLPVGTVFRFFCRADVASTDEEDKLRDAITAFLRNGGVLGGQSSNGLGRWVARGVAVKSYELSDPSHLVDWLINGHGFEWTGDTDSIANWQDFNGEDGDGEWKLTFNVSIEDGLHLSSGRKGIPIKGLPDETQVVRKRIDDHGKLTEEVVDFGSTIRGRLRTAMCLVLRTHLKRNGVQDEVIVKLIPIKPGQRFGDEALNRFFGAITEGNGGRKKNDPSAWKVDEPVWQGVARAKQEHIRLDHLTQHPLNTALFSFEPLSSGKMTVTLSLPKKAKDWERQLIHHAVTLMSLDTLPWGGKASRGYVGVRITDISNPGLNDEQALSKEIGKWTNPAANAKAAVHPQ